MSTRPHLTAVEEPTRVRRIGFIEGVDRLVNIVDRRLRTGQTLGQVAAFLGSPETARTFGADATTTVRTLLVGGAR